ncbi:MAG: biopolymer transporter ExbD [Candidatus Hydrogenedentes bacterium]|nr:biopolymer transporter ExbD [Candidatus Hydrogenedentota bacterium]
MAFSMHRQGGILDEINITPLTDIFLVLLIIMMVVAPLSHQVKGDIRPPEIMTGEPGLKGDFIIEVSKEGAYLVNGKAVTKEELGPLLRDAVVSTNLKELAIRADRSARSRAVIDVIQAAEVAGVEKLTMIGQGASAPVASPVAPPTADPAALPTAGAATAPSGGGTP